MKIKPTVRLLLILMVQPLILQRVHAQSYSLQKCIEVALKNNVQMNITRSSNDIYGVNLRQSEDARYPSLSGSANQQFSFGKSLDPSSYQYVNQNIASNVFSLNSSLILFQGGQVRNSIQQQKQLVEAGKMDVKTYEKNITLSIAGAYLQILLDSELINVSRSAIDRDQKQVTITKVMVKAGSVPELNLFQVQSQLASDEVALTNARNQMSLDKLNLQQLMNIPENASFDIEVPAIPDPAVPSDTSGPATIYARSVEQQPEVKSTELKMLAQKYAYDVAYAGKYPKLLLNSSITTNYSSSRKLSDMLYKEQMIGYLQSNPTALVYGAVPYSTKSDYPFFGQLGDNISEGFTFSLSIPIFQNYSIRANIRQAEINSDIARLNDQYAHEQYRKAIEQGYNDLQAAVKQYAATREALKAENEAFKIMDLKYGHGAANASEMIIEANKFTTAQSQVMQAKYSFIFKQKILDYYQGKSILL